MAIQTCGKNIRKQTQLCNLIGILDNSKLKGVKVQRLWMLQTQGCKSTSTDERWNKLQCQPCTMLCMHGHFNLKY